MLVRPGKFVILIKLRKTQVCWQVRDKSHEQSGACHINKTAGVQCSKTGQNIPY